VKERLRISFLKYHGCGNDFLVIDELERERIPEEFRGKLAILLCKRRFGVGANAILYVLPSTYASAKMRVFPADGSEVDICGNGIRCVADYLCSRLERDEVLIDTNDGMKHVEKMNGLYKVTLGNLRTTKSGVGDLNLEIPANEKLLNRKMEFPNLGEVEISIVRAGEPHGVIFVDDVDKENLVKYGKAIAANRGIFPYGVHVNLVQVVDASTIKIRTYERGVWDETLACGTGATASAAVSYITGRVKEKGIKVKVKGGELIVNLVKDVLFLTGPAARVYEGTTTIDLESLSNVTIRP
jgi:diaminopimelate epimerase